VLAVAHRLSVDPRREARIGVAHFVHEDRRGSFRHSTHGRSDPQDRLRRKCGDPAASKARSSVLQVGRVSQAPVRPLLGMDVDTSSSTRDEDQVECAAVAIAPTCLTDLENRATRGVAMPNMPRHSEQGTTARRVYGLAS
jgi:hypothetical protein